MPPGPSDEIDTALRPVDDSPGAVTAFTLNVVDGPDVGASFVLDPGQPFRVLLGQSPACTIRLRDAHVSRRHAAFELSGGRLLLTDLDSTNGTTVNGVRITGAVLRGGESIRVGDTTLRVDAISAAGDGAQMSPSVSFGRLFGASEEMRRLYAVCERLADTEVPIVIEGETGTGKEVLAESIHEASARSNGPFIVFDCTAVPPSLLESELFGHERGAFTGAVATRKGVFEQASGGTLLIDEIGDLEVSLQPKLLRALERREVRRVGGDRWLKVDVRVIAATRRDLDREVQDGRFRDDLFYRLAVARVELPPLRLRKGDIGFLAEHLWRELGGGNTPLPYELLQRFERYSWPGNVRELANAVARYLAIGDVNEARPAGVNVPTGGDPIDEILAQELPFPRARDQMVSVFERRYVERVLALNGGSVPRAARASGIARRYFNLILARNR